MQYILTQQEYDELRGEQRAKLLSNKAELQKLCTAAANHVPVPRPWAMGDKTPAPWGCILDPNSPNHDGYCDDCPAQGLCPHDGKEYSQ